MSDGRTGWYTGHPYGHQAQQQPIHQPQPADQRSTVAAYPLSSAVPPTGIAQHFRSLAIQPTGHSFAQANLYPSSYAQAPPLGNPPPYSVYDQHLSVQISSGQHQQSWQQQQHPVRQYPSQQHYAQQYSQQPHQQPAFSSSSSIAHALYQAPRQADRKVDAAQFITPAAPSAPSTSTYTSSLAGALGPYPSQPPPPRKYHASESAAFLTSTILRESQASQSSQPSTSSQTQVLTQTQLQTQTQATLVDPFGSPIKAGSSMRMATERDPMQLDEPSPQPRARLISAPSTSTSTSTSNRNAAASPQKRDVFHATPRLDSRTQMPLSPDPLSFDAASPGMVTPRKRKPGDVLESPTVKRAQPSLLSPLKLESGTPTSFQTPQSQRFQTMPVSSSKRMSHVEVPHLPKDWITPVKNAGVVAGTPGTHSDLGGYASASPTKSTFNLQDSMQRSGRKTGDRDDRIPLEKFVELAEEIIAAEDDLSPEGDTSSTLFSQLTVDWSRPMLSPGTVKKLSKLIAKVARPTKRDRLAPRDQIGSPRRTGAGGLADVDLNTITRILKLLERSVHAGEYVDPFAGPPAGNGHEFDAEVTASPSKVKKSPVKKKATASSTSKVIPMVEDGADNEGHGRQAQVSPEDYDKLDRALDAAREAVLAADCCIALLAADKLPKQVYSEELITACLSTVKNLLDKVIYPFVEANSDVHGQSSLILLQVARSHSQAAQARRALVGEIFQTLSSVFPRIDTLIGRTHVAMSDNIIIQAVYIAIGPFFVVEFGTEGSKAAKDKVSQILTALGGSVALRGLRLAALALIRTIFANHDDQRSWIIEEILTSLIKLPDLKQKAGQFRLRDGHSIHTVSALLLQLVQTSAHDVRIEAKKLRISRQQSMVMRHDSMTEVQTQDGLLTDQDREEIQLYVNGLDSATKVAKTIVAFLTQRAGKGKITKNTNEAEYRAIFDNLISDLLAVLFWPEWPAASLLMEIICKYMVSSLDDVKTSQTQDNNAAKSSALDHLGTIAARLRASLLKFSSDKTADGQLRPLDDVVAKMDAAMLDRLITAHQDVMNHLSRKATEDQAYDSAQELTVASWGHEIAGFLTRCESILRNIVDHGGGTKQEEDAVRAIGKKLKLTMHDVWKGALNDVFDVATEEEVSRVDRLAEEIGTIQSLKNAFDPILSVILVSLDSPAVFMRSKALRALGQVIGSDQDILRSPKVRAAIESHLLDNSPAVRDAAVELIGKYIVQSPEIAADYYQRIAERIADTGLGVRKRVIKLIKALYPLSDSVSRQADISTRLVLRQLDEDDTVKELATKTIEDLWFGDTDPLQKAKSPQEQRTALLNKANVVMQVTRAFGDRHNALEDMLHRICNEREGKEKDTAELKARYAAICDVLIEGLVDPQDFPNFSAVLCIKTIYLFATADPSVITAAKATTLHPYLKSPSTEEEHRTAEYLLKIFRASVPLMPKTAAKFGAELQKTLQPMIIKPSGTGGLSSLQEAVACICSVVQHLSHDYILLANFLKSCDNKMQEFIKRRSAELQPSQLKSLSILIIIVSLLTQHCDFDKLRSENSSLENVLNAVSKSSISLHVYSGLLTLYNSFDNLLKEKTEAAERERTLTIQGRCLQCLGFLFRAYPTLMITDESAELMDRIFKGNQNDIRARLLKIIQDFLVSESQKHSAREKEAQAKAAATSVNMDKLVGNTQDFAESGVASAVVQRYLQHILDSALSKDTQIQHSSLEILTFTIKQGLAHPLQCLPVIVALETSDAEGVSSRAIALHAVLHSKHASLVNVRYIECTRMSFSYQENVREGNPVQGYRAAPVPTALLHPWYSLIREKRATRQEFLKSLVRAFDVDVTALSSTQNDINFARYMAENLALLDYKTNEEVLTVIRHLTSVLSVSGLQLIEVISPSNLLRELHDNPNSAAMVCHVFNLCSLSLARTSVVMGVSLLLRAHLKWVYSLSEDKCMKWQPGKKSALGDKPAVRRGEGVLVWDRMPSAIQPFNTAEDIAGQYRKFLDLWSEDGVKEPIDEAD
ncbi:hypothetical protein BKA62DRAFT_696412 [Auriculariales sp. MPI-PUGE-AT-0066]|nr:hypothetical protein BKA62DRAFT_696412 [Auriculariales sp. MPI-PUGE-AT-0066]